MNENDAYNNSPKAVNTPESRCVKFKHKFHLQRMQQAQILNHCIANIQSLRLNDSGKQSSISPPNSSQQSPYQSPNSDNPQEFSRDLQCCIQSLNHACQCSDANCSQPSCKRMKMVVLHAMNCQRKGTGACKLCKIFIKLNWYHAKTCQEAKCPVLFCINFKHKFKLQRKQQAKILKHCIANMQRLDDSAKQSSCSPPNSIQQSPDPSPNSDNPQEFSRNIQLCIQSLNHACQCRDANCSLPSCKRMKMVVLHAKNCQRKGTGTCKLCKPFIAFKCYHAKTCQEAKCSV